MADNQIYDLDVLFPDEPVVHLTDRSGKEYNIKLFIPSIVGFLIIDNFEKIKNIFEATQGNGKIDQEAIDILEKILVAVIKHQFKELDVEWVRQNLSLQKQAFIIYQLAVPVMEFLQQQGLMETEKP
jgi:hypothetical protein